MDGPSPFSRIQHTNAEITGTHPVHPWKSATNAGRLAAVTQTTEEGRRYGPAHARKTPPPDSGD
ncbi:hypothetical protein dsmv_0109 [Desulfococcus multivorans DSM 2059]|uniref:Uncharacterized protein n=1 Tax=Desulfococcus multivorans DSM 2059 TaxID=1121405 RepID=S7V587_DESML|nr:uncharacterized protein Dmul_03260 [Desulfococcus multivorans]EPR41809.1 hypothetical protein dsmv_0109 [Desulfococcus multivorans DSM 2059]SJZ87500.1 hypothetical protein SAMN02745446_01924 [Desulfococcus multivorans DSM 2059]